MRDGAAFNKIQIGILILILSSGCDKEKTDTNAAIFFSGLTTTDINGYIFSRDTSDWKFNDIWIEKESDLFVSHFQEGCSPPYHYGIIAYPNPCNGNIAFSIDKDSSSYLQIRLVDENFNKVIVNDSIAANDFILDAGPSGIKDTVRLYF